MCGGKIGDVATDAIWKILIGSGQVKVKSRHVLRLFAEHDVK
jgi:hypothetical protein